MSNHRLTLRDGVGTLIDGSSGKVNFTFDGKPYTGRKGDTLASALLANGVKLIARSFKYHRPRGIVSAGSEEPSALVTLRSGARSEPNIRATEIELYEGLEAKSQNRFPSLAFDAMAVNQLAGKALGAGFYYKTFMGPKSPGHTATKFWEFCEASIRRAAGLGRAPLEADPDRYARMHAYCDVLVVGSGAAGIAAARRAASAGARVILCDERATAGGSLTGAADMIGGEPAHVWVAEAVAELAAMDNVTVLTRTTVQSLFDDGTIFAIERVADHKATPDKGEPRQRAWQIVAKSTVIATGALERPIVFGGNDRPGVMLADAARRYAVEFGVAPGRAVTVFTNNDTGWLAARDMARTGTIVNAIIDVRQDVSDHIRAAGAETRAAIHVGSAVVGTHGWNELTGISVGSFDERTGVASPGNRRIPCDCLAVSGGWSPAFHLTSQQGGKPIWDAELQAFLPGEPAEESNTRWHGAGAMAGKFGLRAAFRSGEEAAAKALADASFGEGESHVPSIDGDELDHAPAPVFEIRNTGKAFVDLQHDVTADDVRLAEREGFRSVEHLKRYTTLGMATDQGKTSNVTGLAIMAHARNMDIPDVGTTRFRPPYTPTAIGTIAGEAYGHLAPTRRTPMQDWHEARARCFPNGPWMRPESYNADGESVEQAYIRETKAVRAGVGIVDVSTLGKIDIQGPDATEFINRIYSNAFAKLPVGKARYGLMLREDGILFDDGTTWRLDDHRYLMTTTTAGAGLVMEHLEYHRDVVWPDLKVALTSVTDEWAGVAVAGPKSRDLLAACVEDCDVSDTGLPFMGVRDGTIGGIPVKLARLSFSGEMAFEVYCGFTHGQAIWDALLAAGEPLGVTPYGLEALGTLRIEKGHVAGPELNGRTTAHDLGLGGMVSTKKPFVGKVLGERPALHEDDRLQLVAIASLDGQRIRGGSHLVQGGKDDVGRSEGHTTSTCFSPELNRYVSLALLEGGRARHGERMFAANPIRGMHVAVEVVSPHMVDPDGGRMRG
ncbi:sarcosine oxidase subunit alpha family protein [Ahrensia sp. R2A130]|uniref:sarcosine oxidase subunit alpha family protein n=1 Tax=Ahrensia sp. R2A130 TaxID=744979 RepID=UPI0001E083E5|nr:sarcosine oxidase subunit alpha family protein [Ahrensia sp. R2A130]EFL89228.1 sarcosine oxidase subunit alpha [Ahrensia sp. R2A130]